MKLDTNAVAEELISIGEQQGLDLAPFCAEGFFQKDRRWIFFWRKDELPRSGRADEALGTLHYNLQGSIAALPGSMTDSASAFTGMWSESGTFENIEQAIELLGAWLLEGKEIDHLPERRVSRAGIG